MRITTPARRALREPRKISNSLEHHCALVPAAMLLPVITWGRKNGRSVESDLERFDLLRILDGKWGRSVPLFSTMRLISFVSQSERAADLPAQIASECIKPVLPLLIAGSETPFDVFTNLNLGLFSPHLSSMALNRDEGVSVAGGIRPTPVSGDDIHYTEQYIIEVARQVVLEAFYPLVGRESIPVFLQVWMAPLGKGGCAHLTSRYGRIVIVSNGLFGFWIHPLAAFRPFTRPSEVTPEKRLDQFGDWWRNRSFVDTLDSLIDGMDDKPATMRRLAKGLGVADKTLGRRVRRERLPNAYPSWRKNHFESFNAFLRSVVPRLRV